MPQPFDTTVLHRHGWVEALGDRVGDDGLPLLLKQDEKALLLRHKRVDLGRLAIEEGELWPNLGDADLREAAYRGGWKPA